MNTWSTRPSDAACKSIVFLARDCSSLPTREQFAIELTEKGIPFEREKEFVVTYRGQPLCRRRIDFVVDGRVLLELKAVDRLTPVHRAQVHSYLRSSQIPIGLLMNFNEVLLQDGIKRIIL